MELQTRRSWVAGSLIALGVLGSIALIALSTTLFEDDFSPPKEGWLMGASPDGNAVWSFTPEEYEVLMTRPQGVSLSLNPSGQNFAEYCTEIKAVLLSLIPGEVGLVFGAKDKDQGQGQEGFATFGIFADGSYRLGRLAEGKIENLPVSTEPLKLGVAGTSSLLRVVAKEGTLEFYGNDQLLATLRVEDVPGLDATGEIGFFGHTVGAPLLLGRFDFIRIRTPDCAP